MEGALLAPADVEVADLVEAAAGEGRGLDHVVREVQRRVAERLSSVPAA